MNRRAFLRRSTTPPAHLTPVSGMSPPVLRTTPPDRESPAPKPLDIDAGLEPYSAPLDRRRAAHLLRRTGFGARPDQVTALLGMSAEAAVDVIVDEAFNTPLPEPPEWVDEAVPRDRQEREEVYMRANNDWMLELRIDWFMRMFHGGLRERLTLFWHNHFVTEIDAYFFLAVYAYRYLNTLRTHALGNFKDFVYAIGIDPAMLYYLNGAQNRVGEPNENYARELLELFTMGQYDSQGTENYTQEDIEEIARALTGWLPDPFTLTVQHVTAFFDNGEKTIFGQTGPFDYDGVIDLLFQERHRQIATFISRKLYQEFVYAGADEDFVADLAGVFVAHDFDLAPVLRTLLQSAHFMDDQVAGAQIKSPVMMVIGLLNEAQYEDPPPTIGPVIDRYLHGMEQRLLDPPNVAGWEGHHAWLNTTTLPIRWRVADAFTYAAQAFMVPLAERVLMMQDEPVDPYDPESAFTLPRLLAEHLLAVPVETLDLVAPADDFAGDLTNHPIPDAVLNGPAYARDLAKIFLAGLPWYEWYLYREEAPFLLLNFTRYLTRIPEFQLT